MPWTEPLADPNELRRCIRDLVARCRLDGKTTIWARSAAAWSPRWSRRQGDQINTELARGSLAPEGLKRVQALLQREEATLGSGREFILSDPSDAAEELLVAGFDRADIDVSASFDELQRRLSYGAIPAPDIADVPTAPRQPFLGEDDVEVADAVVGCVAGSAAAVAMAFFLVVNDFRPIPVGILSVLIGLIVGGGAVLWARRRWQRERARGLEKLAEAHGLLIWVRVRSPEQETRAQEILMRHGGEAVHVHEIELAKRPEDLPLHELRPDPWLGDERLGQP